jgi:hypothetical protein
MGWRFQNRVLRRIFGLKRDEATLRFAKTVKRRALGLVAFADYN